MGLRGPAPKSQTELRLSGSRRAKDRHVLELEHDMPAMPDHLDANGVAEWERVQPALEEKGAIARIDTALLTMICELWSDVCRLRDAECAFEMGSQEWGRIRKELTAARRLYASECKRFGIGPADRTRVPTPPPSDDVGDEAEILKGSL